MFLEHQISILEWSCDTEDLSTDAENSILKHLNKKFI